MTHYDYFLKVIIVGNESVGKSQILNQWCRNKFEQNSLATRGSDYCTKSVDYKNRNIKLQLWDTSGNEMYQSLISSFLHKNDVKLIFIVIAANDSTEQKIQQINNWLDKINNYKVDHKIIIIENKTDLAETSVLSNADLMKIIGSYAYKVSTSAKHHESFVALNNALDSVLPQIFPGLASLPNENNPAPLSTRTNYDVTKNNINALNDTHVNMLLLSLRNLLTRGPVNQPNKSYDMKFGGGTFYLNEKKVTEHVHTWLVDIRDLEASTPTDKRRYLITLYEDIIKVSQTKPFTRSSSTHVFYKEQLPGFIEYCVKQSADGNFPYFLIRDNLKKLTHYPNSNSIDAVCNDIVNHLQRGVLDNPAVPYKVTFFGSKKYKLPNTENIIAVPAHVATILNYLINDPTNNLLKLNFVLDFCIVTQFSICSTRERSTQDFYDQLPTFIATTIADKLQSLQSTHSLQPPR